MSHTAAAGEDFSHAGFHRKLGKAIGRAGREVLEHALQLYFAARSPHTPAWAKSVIYGALAYFVSAIDGLPDFTPVVGYSDDLVVLTAAAATVAAHIGAEERARAREVMARLGLAVPA